MKKVFFLLLLLFFPSIAFAADITNNSSIFINNTQSNKIKDQNENTYITISKNDTITIKSDEDIYGIYIVYEFCSKSGTIKNSYHTYTIGSNHFLHEYINVEKLIGHDKEFTIQYDEEVKIAEIYVLDDQSLPDYIEIWEQPASEADLLLFSTHSDDEQLFFLGLLPTYVSKNAKVQVVYFTNHFDNPKRLHEQLHGLYTVGIRNYPIIGIVPDAWSDNLESAIKNMKKANLTIEDATLFEVEMIRRFKPLVVVGHDEKGEYSHGQHILNTYVLKTALEKAADSTYDIESYNNYGIWDVPKTYLHLYKENPIMMNYDIPLDYFDGKTAYEVSKEGYSKHISQQGTWFTAWMNGKNKEYKKATDIKTYSPVEFGLYRSLVGEDILKNDMFENLTLRKDEVPTVIHDSSDNPNENTEYKEDISFQKIIGFYSVFLILLLLIILILKLSWKKRMK